MNTTTPVFCKNCVHVQHQEVDKSLCTHHEAQHDIELVHGKIVFHSAAEMRRNRQLCGTDARYFAAKPPPRWYQRWANALGFAHD